MPSLSVVHVVRRPACAFRRPERTVTRAVLSHRQISREKHAGGLLELVELTGLQVAPYIGPALPGAVANSPETGTPRERVPRLLRIWTPPGFSQDQGGDAGYPVVYLNDAQNLFEDKLSFSGVSWRAGIVAAELIASGMLPPFLIVGIDHASALRSWDYLPAPPGTGAGGFRPEAATWPGGGVEKYVDSVVQQVLPLAEKLYGASADPARRVFGGSSFGAIAALAAARRHPGTFGSLLLESPSFWFAGGKYLAELQADTAAPWPPRIYAAMGTKEYSGTRAPGDARPAADALLVAYADAFAAHLRACGLGSSRLDYLRAVGGAHNERDWAVRLPRALTWVGKNWWESGGASTARHSESAIRATARAEVESPPRPELGNERAAANDRWFSIPRSPVAGEAVVLYFNKRKSPLWESPNLRVTGGYNGWKAGLFEAPMTPANLPKWDDVDWWSTRVVVPRDAHEWNFSFSDGGDIWDNNEGSDYMCSVREIKTAKLPPRAVERVERFEHAGGTLHLLHLGKREGAGRSARWQEEKLLRVWTPPGFDADAAPEGGWPVLYVNDGQNLFEDFLAHQGVSWRLGYTASELIASGVVPPFVVVGIDASGVFRSLNFLPYPPGSGAGNFRPECARWPGGGVDAYLERVTDEILPLVASHFRTSLLADRVAFGGASFGGMCSLYAAIKYPHVFGAVLVESPSLWAAEGRFLSEMAAHDGALPARLFLGVGTREYSATRDHERLDVDSLLEHYGREAARILREKGMTDGTRLMFQVEEGAGHHEGAWAWRLTGALTFLLSPWKSIDYTLARVLPPVVINLPPTTERTLTSKTAGAAVGAAPPTGPKARRGRAVTAAAASPEPEPGTL